MLRYFANIIVKDIQVPILSIIYENIIQTIRHFVNLLSIV